MRYFPTKIHQVPILLEHLFESGSVNPTVPKFHQIGLNMLDCQACGPFISILGHTVQDKVK